MYIRILVLGLVPSHVCTVFVIDFTVDHTSFSSPTAIVVVPNYYTKTF